MFEIGDIAQNTKENEKKINKYFVLPPISHFTLPYVAQSYPKVGLYCSRAENRVPVWWGGGVGWCKPIIMSNSTLVELC